MSQDSGRRRHYGAFYRLDATPAPDDRPLWLVVGNCQAEALRLTLDTVEDQPYRTVRIPPVHELTRDDLPHLEALLARTELLLSQPVRTDYRGLPLGTNQLAQRLPRSGRSLRWPVIRYAGLYPFQVIVRHPGDRSAVPPVVAYHDLRTIAAARAGSDPEDPWDVEVTAAQVRAVAAASRDELAARERRDCDVAVSDVLERHGADATHTINHPGNAVLADLAHRILESAAVPASVRPPPRTLLDSVYAPLEQRVLDALGIAGRARSQWSADGEPIAADFVHQTQSHWYADNPDYLEFEVERHARTMEQLGLLGASTRR